MMSSRCITPALGDRQSGPPLAEAAGHGETETNRRPRRTACRPGLKINNKVQREVNKFISITDQVNKFISITDGPFRYIAVWFFLCKATDKCKILTFSIQKNQ